MNKRRRMNGVVVGNKMEKTVLVEITRTFQHPVYKKVVHDHMRVKAHDTLSCQLGDKVVVVESKPISKDKRWVVESIVKHSVEDVVIEEGA